MIPRPTVRVFYSDPPPRFLPRFLRFFNAFFKRVFSFLAGQGLWVLVFAGACQGTVWAGSCLIHHHQFGNSPRGGLFPAYGALPSGLWGSGKWLAPQGPNRLRPRRPSIGQYCLSWGWGLKVRLIHTSPKASPKAGSQTQPPPQARAL